MGLLDILDDESMRLGINLLAAASPTMRPAGFGERLGLAMRGMDAQRDRALNNKLNQEHFDLQKSYKALQEQQMTAAIKQQERDAAVQEQFMGLLPGLLGGQPQAPQPMPLPQLGEAQGTGPYRLNVDTPEQRAALSKQLDSLSRNDPMAHQQVIAALVKQGAIPQPMMPAQAPQPDANAAAQLGMFGQMAGVKGAQGLYNYAKDFMRPDWQQIDSGGQIQFVNKNSGQMPTIGKTMSPDAMASNQVAWANNAISQQNADIARFNAQKPTYHDGALVSPTGEIVKTPMYAPPKGSPEASAQASARIVPLLNAADKLLDKSTGSYAGTALDMAAGVVGMSTKGAQAAAQLKALEGQIMLSQPRMEGPQSDKDVALYRQMAGQIGDSTVPAETRRAAIEGIRAMHEKYSGGQFVQPQSTMSGGGWSATILK